MALTDQGLTLKDETRETKELFYSTLHTLFMDAYQDFAEGLNSNDAECFREAMAKFMVIYHLDDRQKMIEDAKIKLMEIAYNLEIPWEKIEKEIQLSETPPLHLQH